MKKNADEVIALLQENIDTLRRFGVKRIGLFGSIVRGEGTEKSDLDFLVEFEQKSFDSYMDLKSFLEDLFGCRVDLVLADTIKPRLRKSILNEVRDAQGL